MTAAGEDASQGDLECSSNAVGVLLLVCGLLQPVRSSTTLSNTGLARCTTRANGIELTAPTDGV